MNDRMDKDGEEDFGNGEMWKLAGFRRAIWTISSIQRGGMKNGWWENQDQSIYAPRTPKTDVKRRMCEVWAED